ncbi:MAG: hypothetical protein VX246_09370 [Myxococcota bacterium]|nr:hypothetical protein [Myxococcota bacterium]
MEPLAVVEVPKVGEFVAKRVDETRVLERPTCRDVPQTNTDRPVVVTNPVSILDVRTLGFDAAVLQPELLRDAEPVPVQPPNQLLILGFLLGATHPRRVSLPVHVRSVK